MAQRIAHLLVWLGIAIRWGGFAVIGMIGAWASNQGYLILTTSDRPLVILERPHEQDRIAQRGGTLQIRTTLIRDTDCTGLTERWMRRPVVIDGKPLVKDGEPVIENVLLSRSGPPPVPLHRKVTVDVLMQVPLDVGTGTWYYWTRSTSDCRWKSQFLATLFGKRSYEDAGTAPDFLGTPFQVVDPTKQAPAEVTVPTNAPVVLLPESVKP